MYIRQFLRSAESATPEGILEVDVVVVVVVVVVEDALASWMVRCLRVGHNRCTNTLDRNDDHDDANSLSLSFFWPSTSTPMGDAASDDAIVSQQKDNLARQSKDPPSTYLDNDDDPTFDIVSAVWKLTQIHARSARTPTPTYAREELMSGSDTKGYKEGFSKESVALASLKPSSGAYSNFVLYPFRV